MELLAETRNEPAEGWRHRRDEVFSKEYGAEESFKTPSFSERAALALLDPPSLKPPAPAVKKAPVKPAPPPPPRKPPFRRPGNVWLASCLFLAAMLGYWALPTTTHKTVVENLRAKNIEDVKPGDHVLAKDPATGEIARRKVVEVFRRESDHLRILEIRAPDGAVQRIETTNEHPFFLKGGLQVSAGDLEPGDKLAQYDGGLSTLLTTAYDPRPEGVTVYNFHVEGFHTYFVAAGGSRAPPVWVHNMCAKRTGAKPGPKTDRNAPHNAKIRSEADKLESEGNKILRGGGREKEKLIPTPGGKKSGRRPDILYETPDGQLRGRNIGKTKADGTPVTREVDALEDLNGPGGLPTDFVP